MKSAWQNSAATAVFMAALLLSSTAAVAADVTFKSNSGNGIFDQVFTGCLGCHGSGGGPDTSFKANPNTPDAFHSALIGTNSRESKSGKRIVSPYLPHESFLLDKLTGKVRTGERDPMPTSRPPPGGPGYVYSCPGHIEVLKKWIAQGADRDAPIEGVTSLSCAHEQPAFVAPPAPDEGYQIFADPFDVDRKRPNGTTYGPLHGDHVSESVPVGNDATVYATKIEIVASAGTEWVSVARAGEDVPFAVARGESLTLELPDGVGIELGPDAGLEIRQWIRNEYWLNPDDPENPLCGEDGCTNGEYRNRTRGEAAVNLHTTTDTLTAATPFRDTMGTQAMFVSPDTLGSVAGLWIGDPSTVNGAMVGMWADSRAIQTGLVDVASQSIHGEPAEFDPTGVLFDGALLREQYVEITALGLPAGTIGYMCSHSNGVGRSVDGFAAVVNAANPSLVAYSRPQRFGCAEQNANVPGGTPGTPAVECYQDHGSRYGSDCAALASGECRPANLVGGEAVEDGRCELIGLYW